jgi:predicted component of type VI protein secretion system
MLTLILKEGAAPVTLRLEQDVINIGRAKDNEIVIKNIKASRRHARIERIGATYQVTDLGSGNGTKVNGKKIDFQAIKQGDEIGVGDARLTLKSIDDSVDAMDVEDEIKLEETDTGLEMSDEPKLELTDDRDTERLEISEAETEVQAPSVKAKSPPPAKTAPKPAPKPAVKPSPVKPALGSRGAPPPAAAKPGLKRPLGRQTPK